MNLQLAFERSERLESKIPKEYIEKLTGLSSPKVWHLLNNLCSEADTYLEIGTYMGSSLMAALYGNSVSATAVDNFCMKPHTRGHFFNNTKHLQFTFIEQDCFTIKPNIFVKPIELYFFDGEHTYEAQYKALDHFLSAMKNEFVYIVDDWTNQPVKEGTFDAIQKNNIDVLEMIERGEGKLKDKDGWWCGVAAFKLRKP
jgi:hypothetical protein